MATNQATEKSSLHSEEMRFLKIEEVTAISGRSRSSIYDAVKKGVFPAPVKIGQRSSAWVRSEVIAWMTKCIESRK